jgi:hypothetical protein
VNCQEFSGVGDSAVEPPDSGGTPFGQDRERQPFTPRGVRTCTPASAGAGAPSAGVGGGVGGAGGFIERGYWMANSVRSISCTTAPPRMLLNPEISSLRIRLRAPDFDGQIRGDAGL